MGLIKKTVERVWVERETRSVWFTDPKSVRYIEFVRKELFLERLRDVLQRHLGKDFDYLSEESVEQVVEKMKEMG